MILWVMGIHSREAGLKSKPPESSPRVSGQSCSRMSDYMRLQVPATA